MVYIAGMIVWLLTALVAISIGVNALIGFDCLSLMPQAWRKTFGVIVFIAGFLSLF